MLAIRSQATRAGLTYDSRSCETRGMKDIASELHDELRRLDREDPDHNRVEDVVVAAQRLFPGPKAGPSEYRLKIIPTAQGYDVIIDHTPTWRRKSGSVAQLEYVLQLAQGLRGDIETDLADVAAGHMPESAGRRTPESER